ncbi:SH3 domain-containing protein [Gluconacetobacter sacchari]|uniref:SH3 domain-containing protein n=1 Tax=Gluconacetobacter sacchari TaxID=92759 RepID=UPI0039B48DA4
MPKVSGHEPVFKAYLPKLRLREFPQADWRFVIHVAANTARAFATVHASSLVVGDVNHGNLVVSPDATVRMIDCDSFQVASKGKTWFCEVGVATHQPPEMQGRDSYRGILRTPNHDNFGLAVIIFQLLCVARHPFSGVFLGRGDPPSIEEAIAASRYAYSTDHARTGMRPPPGSLPIEALTPALKDLFEKAFSPGNVQQGRPHAQQWVQALEDLSSRLTVCSQNKGHYFRKGYHSCPWCSIEGSTGVTLFPAIFAPRKNATGNPGIMLVWQEIAQLRAPPPLGPFPPQPPPASHPSPEAAAEAKACRQAKGLSWLGSVTAVVLALTVAPGVLKILLPLLLGAGILIVRNLAMSPSGGGYKPRLDLLQTEWNTLGRQWATQVRSRSFLDALTALNALKAQFDALGAERARRLQRLQEDRHRLQHHEFLDRFAIAATKIPGIGPAKVSALSSFGIDTAADITSQRVLSVPGFGQALASKMLAWRAQCEAGFRFDPSRGVSPREVTAVEQDIAAKKAALEKQAADGLLKIRAVSAQTVNAQNFLVGRAQELKNSLSQALADFRAVPMRLRARRQILGCAAAITMIAGVSGLVRAPLSESNPTLSQSAPQRPLKDLGPSSQEIRQPKPSDAALAPATSEVIMIQTANIHSRPNVVGSNVGIATNGTRYKVFDRQSHWLQIGQGSPIGWVYSDLTRPSKS